jgi:hypothetical protein
MQPTVLLSDAGAPGPPAGARDLLRVAGGLLAVAVVAGAILLARRPPPRTEPATAAAIAKAPSRSLTPTRTPLAEATVAIVTDPKGAVVTLDGNAVSGTTPLDLRIDPSREHRITLSLEGYAPHEARLAPGEPPAEVRAALEPAGPLGRVAVVSSYPVEVFWKGKLLGKGASPQLSLPVGRQVLTLVSGAHFLRANVAVNVRPETVGGVEAPRLGRINIKASPDNCEVFIDGSFVDYPPILDRAVAAGAHTVAFKWPDGTRREERAEVEAGSPVYVLGRKD